ncbi:hypothetical protein GOEFS_110_00240 [Gordonia effusa NBRC 100432]|uniref:Mce-associated membrane protein n=1 Tax=Gordonia effusa NBRC 100432 TaxID=1077974 RepID=H0R5E5_9ACTN|nr:hypothetical protein [Gordonia effusa]GAB20296.1 hypothetical protein GOEFS_110_00240 [Gordonia effusa NBRC 100432]
MATRRPNKGTPARPVRKPTVAGRKRTSSAADVADTGKVEAVETPKPVEAEPIKAKPVETEAVEAKPVETEPVETKPVETKPVETEPVETKPVETSPVQAPKTSLTKPDDDFVSVDDVPRDADATSESIETVSATTESGVKADSDADTEADPIKPSGKSRRPVSRVSTIKAGAASKAEPTVGQQQQQAARKRSSLVATVVTWRTTKIVAAVAVLLGIVAAILAWTPGATIGDNKAFVDKSATTEVLTQGRNRLCAPLAYEVKGYDKWVQNGRLALTGQALTEFNKTVETQRSVVEQANSSTLCRIDTVGVQTLSGDRAALIASLVLSRDVNGSVLDSQVIRIQADMVKKGDNWLIENLATL